MEQLLATKLYIPPVRPELVLRPRLVQQLNNGLYRKLTLISAPAGFGKTTLIREWLGTILKNKEDAIHADYEVAWFSLDKGDNEEIRFLNYFVTALKQVSENEVTIGERADRMLQSIQSPKTDVVLTSLINRYSCHSEENYLCARRLPPDRFSVDP